MHYIAELLPSDYCLFDNIDTFLVLLHQNSRACPWLPSKISKIRASCCNSNLKIVIICLLLYVFVFIKLPRTVAYYQLDLEVGI